MNGELFRLGSNLVNDIRIVYHRGGDHRADRVDVAGGVCDRQCDEQRKCSLIRVRWTF
jgi:hypothetical protein